MNLPAAKQFDLPFQKNPFGIDNIKAYKQLKQIINKEQYNIIHCHTPIAAAITRLAARNARPRGTWVLYTAHGFHFYTGAPVINWMIYYPVEKWLAGYTDCLINLNSEDYNRIKNKFKCSAEYIPGIGVDLERFRPLSPEEKAVIRKKYGYRDDDFILIYAAELNKNKNQQVLIKQMAGLKRIIPHIKLLLAGDGEQRQALIRLAESLDLQGDVEFLGHRWDMADLLPICDIGVASSLREGLPVNIIEDMACGLPVAASDNRGHRELIAPDENGFLFDLGKPELFARYIELLYRDRDLRGRMSAASLERVHRYSIELGLENMGRIYSKYWTQTREPEGQ